MHMSHKHAIGAPSRLLVVKYGGSAMAETGPDPVLTETAGLWKAGNRVVVVHGGGPDIDRSLSGRGIPTVRIDGLRVTDAATLQVTEAVLCGTVNKRIVRALAALGVAAAGVSGQDGGTLIAQRERADLGYVGRVTQVDVRLVCALLDAGFLPVVAPLAVAADAAHALNVNADLSAAALAAALRADAFVAVTDVARVYRDRRDPASGIARMSLAEARAFADAEACHGSMKPKLRGCVEAVGGGARAAYVCRAAHDGIARALAGDATVIAG